MKQFSTGLQISPARQGTPSVNSTGENLLSRNLLAQAPRRAGGRGSSVIPADLADEIATSAPYPEVQDAGSLSQWFTCWWSVPSWRERAAWRRGRPTLVGEARAARLRGRLGAKQGSRSSEP